MLLEKGFEALDVEGGGSSGEGLGLNHLRIDARSQFFHFLQSKGKLEEKIYCKDNEAANVKTRMSIT